MRCITALHVLALVVATDLLPGQRAEPGDLVREDFAFPTFVNGDGRQTLAEFRGQPVLVVTFADVFGGMAAAMRAVKLHRKFADDGLVVILTHVKAGSTFGSGAEGKDLGAWSMKRYPGWDVRICERINAPWDWFDKGMPPLFAVIGCDGKLVLAGSTQRDAKRMDEAVRATVKRAKRGWGSKEESAVRGLLHGKGDLAAARAKATTDALRQEVTRVYARRLATIRWFLEDGQWLRAKRDADLLAKGVKGVGEWEAQVADLQSRFASEAGKRELALDARLHKLLKPFAKKAPRKGADKALRRLAEQNDGTKVGARAGRLAERVALAVNV